MSTVLVVGAAGNVGSTVVRGLLQKGQRVRALSSRPPRAGAREVEWVQVDVVDGQNLRHAFEGVQSAFVFAPPGHANQHEISIPLIRQARASGVQKVVLMSAMGANADSQSPLRLAELELEGSGLAWNIVRPNWFMQNFDQAWLPAIVASGQIQLPVGRAKTSFVDARDVGAVVARLLVSTDQDNRDFDLSGARALDHDEVAALLSKASGRAIGYQAVEPEALRHSLLQAGLNASYVDFLLKILGFLAAGYNERTTDAVEVLLGREPISFEQYALDHARVWAAA